MNKKNKRFGQKSEKIQFVNRRIRAQKVLCIDQNNINLGILATSEALKIALDSGLDLVQVSHPADRKSAPTCKILDYGKYRYNLSKKEKANAKKMREAKSKLKEVKLRPTTDDNDIRVKANKVDKFLDDGCNVKITVMFRGREIAHKDIAFDRLDDLIGSLSNKIKMISPSKMEGKTLSTIITKSSASNEITSKKAS